MFLSGCGGGGESGATTNTNGSVDSSITPVTTNLQGSYVLKELKRYNKTVNGASVTYNTSYDDVTMTPSTTPSKVYGTLKMGTTSWLMFINFVDGSITNLQGNYVTTPTNNSTVGNFTINNSANGSQIELGTYSLVAPDTFVFTVSPYIVNISSTYSVTTTKTYTFQKTSNSI
jgi:hypothetical protein